MCKILLFKFMSLCPCRFIKYTKIYYWIVLLGLCIPVVRAQVDFFECYSAHETSDRLPDQLLQARSAVFLQAIPEDLIGYTEQWQAFFAEVGIDVILYGIAQDLFVHRLVMEKYTRYLTDREVDYLLFIDPGDSIQQLRIGAFAPNGRLLEEQANYLITAPDWLGLKKQLHQDITQQQLTRSNFLVLEAVEWLPQFPILSESPIYLNLPTDLTSGEIAIATVVGSCDGWITAQNDALQAWFHAHYPYPHAFIDFDGNPTALYKQGYSYVLMPVYGTQTTLAGSLELPSPDSPYSVGYGFYLLHIYSSRIYTLSTWRSSMVEALSPLLQNITELTPPTAADSLSIISNE